MGTDQAQRCLFASTSFCVGSRRADCSSFFQFLIVVIATTVASKQCQTGRRRSPLESWQAEHEVRENCADVRLAEVMILCQLQAVNPFLRDSVAIPARLADGGAGV